jgi:hypothetical protein
MKHNPTKPFSCSKLLPFEDRQNMSCPGGGGLVQLEGEEAGKGGRKVNVVQELCTRVSKRNAEMILTETVPGMGVIMESRAGDEFTYDKLTTL